MMARSNPGKVWGLHAIGPQMDRGRARMARDWAGLCPYSKVSKVTVGLESYGAEPREVRTKHRRDRCGSGASCIDACRRYGWHERSEGRLGSCGSACRGRGSQEGCSRWSLERRRRRRPRLFTSSKPKAAHLIAIVNGRTYIRYALGLCTGLSRDASS